MFILTIVGDDDAQEEAAGEQGDNEPDSEDAAPKAVGIILIKRNTC